MYTIYNKHIIQQLYQWSICFLTYYIEFEIQFKQLIYEMHKSAYSNMYCKHSNFKCIQL